MATKQKLENFKSLKSVVNKVQKTIKVTSKLNSSKLNQTEKISLNNSSFQKNGLNSSKLQNKTSLKPITGKKKTKIFSMNPNGNISNIEEEEAQEKVMNKDLGEILTSNQKALKLIDETLDVLQNNKMDVTQKGNEKYELIDKEEFAKIKVNNEEYKKEKKLLSEEYQKLKDSYEKITSELKSINDNYYTAEKKKTDSITVIYSIEDKLKQIQVENYKLQNEIGFEMQQKNNVFRALEELQNSYSINFPTELEEIISKIKSDKHGEANINYSNQEKVDYLEEEIEKLQKELEEKNKIIENLSKKQQN